MSVLGNKLSMIARRFTGKDYLNESDVEQMLKELRISLLEADVNIGVMRGFLARVKEQALGEKILKGLKPGDQVVKVVKDELTKILGSTNTQLSYAEKGLSVFLMMGLQGSGKTTSIVKLAKYIKDKEKKKVLLIAADVYRPGAVEQLKVLAQKAEVDVFSIDNNTKVLQIVKQGMDKAKSEDYNLVLIDTAGRLTIDVEMMNELKEIKKLVNPNEVILTVDSMTGQDAANTCKAFHEQLQATGAILTKLDGDTRGGAALSIKEVANIPIYFSCDGEHLDAIEVFHPDRFASRILDMGDVLSLVEKAEEKFDEEESEKLMNKLMSGTFNYNDLLKQYKSMKKMGSISKILGFLPGFQNLKQMSTGFDEKRFDRMKVIMDSMTFKERENPTLIEWEFSRRQRIAKGAGVSVNEVYTLMEMLASQIKMFKKISGMSEEQMEKISQDPLSLLRNKSAGTASYKGKGKGKGHRR